MEIKLKPITVNENQITAKQSVWNPKSYKVIKSE